MSIHIRVLGNWTKALHTLLSAANAPIDMTVFIDGPYGSPEVDIDGDKYKMFLLISGGIGITPLQSFCNQLVYEKDLEGRPVKKVPSACRCKSEILSAWKLITHGLLQHHQ
nr:NADPH oxidase family protein [Pseudoalteromonas sp.]